MWAPTTDAPALYRQAAALDSEDPQAVLAWVNRCGMLWWFTDATDSPKALRDALVMGWLDSDQPPVWPLEKAPGAPAFVRANYVLSEFDYLKVAVGILDSLRGRGPKLDVTEDDAFPRVGRRGVARRGITHLSAPPWAVEEMSRAARGRTIPPKILLVWSAVWAAAEGRLLRTMVPSFAPRYREGSILMSRGSDRAEIPAPTLRVTFRPTSLLACLWWQFCGDAFGGGELRRCACGVWFVGRANKDWHSKTCYMRYYMRTRRPPRRRSPFRKTGL